MVMVPAVDARRLQRRVQGDRVVAECGAGQLRDPPSGGIGTTLLSPPANNSAPEPRSVNSGSSSELEFDCGHHTSQCFFRIRRRPVVVMSPE